MRSVLLLALLAITARAQEFPVAPYTDPVQLDCPWPQSSHYRQPWRAYLETKSGWDFLNGIGVNLHLPDANEDLAMRLLSETGFEACRIEVGFGESSWDEAKVGANDKYARRFALCAQHRLRPTILLNAHHGAPCPMLTFKRRLMADAPAGSARITLDDVADLVVGRSGLSGLTGYWAAEALLTGIDYATGEVTLSKPLPKALAAGEVAMATLRYAPLHPVGTPEFDETAAGWTAHALRVCRLARAAGVEEFDVEIWNELTFGTHFLDIDDYYDRAAPKFPGQHPDALRPGGRCWELARRTVATVKAEFPRARCIWGFSNTTFHHTPIEKLPPGMDGQSYHPYGTGTRKFVGELVRKDQPTLEGFVPTYEMRMPEGFMQTFIQTESLIRHLNPLDRLTRRPPGVARFYHYMTEHGVLAAECAVKDEPGAWRLKALCATRSFCLWLNKGVEVLHYFSAFEKDARSFGLLPANLATLPADAKFDDVATPPMRALRNLTRTFQGSIFLERTQPLRMEVTAIGEQRAVFVGDATHPPLWHREVLAALPFQVDAKKHVIALYVMTRDAAQPLAPEFYRLKISGVFGRKVTCYDPHEDREVPVKLGEADSGSRAVEVTIPVVDHPRLLTISR